MVLSSNCVGVNLVNNTLNIKPNCQVSKHFDNAAVIRKGRILQHRHILHKAVVDNVLHDLVHEVDLIAVKRCIIQELRKGLLGSIHIQANDLTNKLTQRLAAVLIFVVLLGAQFAPKDLLQCLHIRRCQRLIGLQLADEILTMDWNESELENDDLKNYKMKAEFYIRQNQDNEVIAKLKTNKPLTSVDVKALEEILWSELGTKQDYENEYGSKPLGEFVREIVGLDMNAAKEAFAEFLNDTSLDSNQIYFVNQIVEYIVHNGLMKDLSVLQDAPFTDNGSVVEVFTDLTVWLGIKRVIDRINANAIAA